MQCSPKCRIYFTARCDNAAMLKLYSLCLVFFLILAFPPESSASGELAKLREISILVETLSSDAKKLGLTRSMLKNHVFVFLRGKMPQLTVKDFALPYIYINVALAVAHRVSRQEAGYFGSVSVQVRRHVSLLDDQDLSPMAGLFFATVWLEIDALIGGKRDRASSQVLEYLDEQLTEFAADWYRDNP